MDVYYESRAWQLFKKEGGDFRMPGIRKENRDGRSEKKENAQNCVENKNKA